MKNLKLYYGRDIDPAISWIPPSLSFLILSAMVIRDLKEPAKHPISIPLYFIMLVLVIGAIIYYIIDWYIKEKAKKVALELTENELIDFGSNQNIPWVEIYNLVFENGKIKVIFNDDSRAPLTIGMRKIKGDSFENYNLMYDYMEAVGKTS